MKPPSVHSSGNSRVLPKKKRASARKFGLSRLGTIVHKKNDKYKVTVAKNIMILRDLTSLTQSQLAELAGVSLGTINQLEVGGRSHGLRMSTLEKVGNVWKLEPWELMSEKFEYSDFNVE